jgi:hypothetical protein
MGYTHEELNKRQRTQLWLEVYVECIKKPNAGWESAWFEANKAVEAFDQTFSNLREYISPKVKPLEGPAIIHRSIYADEIDELNKTKP